MWSAEEIFRHLIMGMHWIGETITRKPPNIRPLALQTGEIIKTRASLRQVKKALSQVTEVIRGIIINLPNQAWKSKVDIFYGEPSLEKACIGLLMHEVEHHGQLRWIFKRLTK